MPGPWGTEFLARVRELHPATVRILLTGSIDVETAVAAVNEGQVFRLLHKPCDPRRLREAVEQAIELRTAYSEVQRVLDDMAKQQAIAELTPEMERMVKALRTVTPALAGAMGARASPDPTVAQVEA